MEREHRFDIFSGTIDDGPVWMEAVRGLTRAQQRMEEMAREHPGKYFVFSTFSHTVLALTDTSKRLESAEVRRKAWGTA